MGFYHNDWQELSAGDHKSLLSLAPSYGLGLGHLWVPGAELKGLGLRGLGFLQQSRCKR